MRLIRSAAPLLALVTLTATLASCAGTGPSLDAGSDTFEGLDPEVVAEVMANPVAWGKVQEEEEQTRASMAQGIVRNFIQCRAAFDAYRSWVTTGTTPEVPVLSVAVHPLEPATDAIENAQAYIEDAIASGEPAQLKNFLVGEARCGEWIPVEPGRPDGPTIEDALGTLG